MLLKIADIIEANLELLATVETKGAMTDSSYETDMHRIFYSVGCKDRRRRCNMCIILACWPTARKLDNGKAIRETMAADLPLSIDHFRYFAG